MDKWVVAVFCGALCQSLQKDNCKASEVGGEIIK